MNRHTTPVAAPPAPKRRRKSTRGFWVRQLHQWHWISSAVALVGLLLFTVTGFTLNHAVDIEADPQRTYSAGTLDPATLALLEGPGEGDRAAIPAEVRSEVERIVGADVPATPAEWSEFEVYLAMPRPGGDAWVSIDRETGEVAYEGTDRGWIAYLNDLHKGRDTGTAWRWFIDVFVVASLAFIVTGFILLWMHARHRPSTWPLTGLGLLVPVLLALFFIH